MVEVAIPTGTFITGGGYLNETNSAGSKPAANPSKMNFGFNVKYNSKGTNPQGHVNIIYRNAGRVYQIKSNAMDSFGTTLKNGPPGRRASEPPSATCSGDLQLRVEGEPDRRDEPARPDVAGRRPRAPDGLTDKGEPARRTPSR